MSCGRKMDDGHYCGEELGWGCAAECDRCYGRAFMVWLILWTSPIWLFFGWVVWSAARDIMEWLA